MESLEIRSIVYATLTGALPAFIWLWFWLKQDKERPEPRGLLALCVIIGMTAVLLVIPIQKIINEYYGHEKYAYVLWSAVEEIAKYIGVLLIALKSAELDEPVDYPVYFIAVAIGFAALENILFVIEPFRTGDTLTSLMTGNLRFLGATLLHTNASALVGIALGLTHNSNWFSKKVMLLIGLCTAIGLHALFNFFIIESNGGSILQTFGFLWVITIIVMLLFEKLRRMSGIKYV
jgi:RsiW-degrading membrane proteinase PrsW (M82 family)